jgi:hypothetical protein
LVLGALVLLNFSLHGRDLNFDLESFCDIRVPTCRAMLVLNVDLDFLLFCFLPDLMSKYLSLSI